jgi:hypothetical protein
MLKIKIKLYNCTINSQQSQREAIDSSDLKNHFFRIIQNFSKQHHSIQHQCLKFHS